MAIAIISDVHIKKPDDEAAKLFHRFIDQCTLKKYSEIYLLGDIFDLLVGPHLEYMERFSDTFAKLNEFLDIGKITYIEGNHDLHLSRLYSECFRDKSGFELYPFEVEKNLWDKKFYFCHGDFLETGNSVYKWYRKFISNSFSKTIVENILPLGMIDAIGAKASANSKKRGSKYFDEEGTRDSFRKGAVALPKSNIDFIICGHSHVRDDFTFESGKSKVRYLNSGYLAKYQTYIEIDSLKVEFISISD